MTPEEKAILAEKIRVNLAAEKKANPRRSRSERKESPSNGGGLKEYLLGKIAPAGTKELMAGKPMEAASAFFNEGGNQVRGFVGGLSDMAGLGAPMAAGYQSGGGGLLGTIMGVGNAAGKVINKGETVIDDTAQKAQIEELKNASPLGNTLGQMAPAFLAPELGLAGAIPRIGAAGAISGAESGAKARTEGKSGGVDTLIGAGIGAAGQSILGEVLGGGLRWFGDTRSKENAVEGIRKYYADMTGEAFDPQTVIAARKALGDKAMLVDLPEFTEIAKTIMHDPNTVDSVHKLTKAMQDRIQPGTGNVKAGVRDAFRQLQSTLVDQNGNVLPAPRTAAVFADDIKKEKQVISQGFDAVFAPFDNIALPPERLTDIATDVFDATAGGQRGRKLVDNYVKSLTRDGKPLTPRAIQSLRLDLGDAISAAMKKGKSHEADMLIQLKDRLTSDVLDKVPGYPELNARFRNEADAKKAYEMGTKVLSMNNEDLSDLPRQLRAIQSPRDRASMIEGLYKSFENALETRRSSTTAMNKVGDNRDFQAAIKMILPGQEGDQLIQMFNEATTMGNTAGTLVGGSATAARQAQRQANDPGTVVRALTMLGGILNQMTSGLIGASTAGALGAANVELRRAASSKAGANTLADILSLSGHQADQAITAIGNNQVPTGAGPEYSTLQQMFESRLLKDPATIGILGGKIWPGIVEQREERRGPQ